MKNVVVQCYDCGIFTDWNGHKPKYPQCAACESESCESNESAEELEIGQTE